MADAVEDRRESRRTEDGTQEGGTLALITRGLIGLHKQFFGRGATTAKAFFVHPDLLVVELEEIFTTVERTLIQKGQRETVKSTRQTFQSAMRGEFIACIEQATGRTVDCYESVTFTAPDRLLEIYYLEPQARGRLSDGDGVRSV